MPKTRAGPNDDLLRRLAECEERLTGREVRIVSEVRRDPGEAGRSTAAQIADRAGVDKSAVSRLSIRLGYSGFKAFREAVWRARQAARDGGAVSASDHSLVTAVDAELKAVLQAVERTDLAALEESVRQATPLVESAARIVVAGIGAGELMARSVAMSLRGMGKPVKTTGISLTSSDNPPEKWLLPGDLLIAICVPMPGTPRKNFGASLATLPEVLGPAMIWTAGKTRIDTRPGDLVLRVTGGTGLTTITTGMSVFGKVFADTCRRRISVEG